MEFPVLSYPPQHLMWSDILILVIPILISKCCCCCSSIVVSISPLSLSPVPPILTSHPQSCPLLALSMSPLHMFLDDPSPVFPHYPPVPSPLVTVSLFFYYNVSGYILLACLFCFLGSFHLEVRSYGICLSLPGLFHLA